MKVDTPPHVMEDESDGLDQDDFPFAEDDIEIINEADIEEDNDYMESDVDDDAVESLPVKDDADLVFSKHTGSVFCCALNKTGTIGVSGGEDDRSFVWSVETGEILFECTGHKDSVNCAAFNHNDTLLATGDMSGVIKVWQLDSKSIVWDFETADLGWLEWHHGSNVLIAGTSDGESWMWRIPSGECKTFQSYGAPNSCGKILPDGKRIVIGYEDGTARVWDLKTATVLHTISDTSAHSESVTTLDCYKDNVLVMSGSTDCTAKLINSNTGKLVATFQCNDVPEETDNSVETVAFSPSSPLAATGTLNGMLAIWDIPTQMQRHSCKHQTGIVKVVWKDAAPLVYSAGLDGIVRLWDSRSGLQESQWSGHTAEVLDLCISRDGRKLLTSSEDKTCRVFKLSN